MERAFKFRIYPNNKQSELINKTIGCSRFVYNYFLDSKIKYYEANNKGLSYNECSKSLTALKSNSDTMFLKEVDKFSLQNSLRDLEDAFKNFFNGSGYPKFKSKRKSKLSYKTNLTNNNIKVFKNKIKLPKLGLVKRRGYKHINPNKIISATISKSKSDKYYCSLIVDVDIKPLDKTDSNIGIDLGVKDFAVISNGKIIKSPKILSKYEKKIKKLQHNLSRKTYGSRNYHKQKIKLAKAHEKIANIREDFLNKISTKLIRENQIICLEDLNIKDMLRNKDLSKAIADVSLYKFINKLMYKAEWYGRSIIKIDRFYPSSQLCNICNYKNEKVKDLSIRKWTCPICHTQHNRDFNASLNILKEGLRIYNNGAGSSL